MKAALLALALAGLTWATAAAAQPATAPATVPVCQADLPPFVDAELPNGGSLTALAQRAFAAGGLSVRLIQAPWARAYLLASQGNCVLLTLWRTPERDALFDYSLPVAQMELGLFVRADRQTALPPDAVVAYQNGSYLPPVLASGRYRLQALADLRTGAKLLRLGRVDAVFSERSSFEHQLLQQDEAAVRWQAPALEVKPTFMAISKDHPQAGAWLELLNREIRKSVKN